MGYAVITGATGGIGRAITVRLLREGWSVLLVARNSQRLTQWRQQWMTELQIRDDNRIGWLALDLQQPSSMAELQTFLCARQSSLDLVVQAAGCQHFSWLNQQTDAQLEQQLQLNLLAPLRLARMVLPLLGQNGTLVNIGSSFGEIGFPGFVPYCASKAGLAMATEALAREVGPQGPRICLLAPRATDTELNSNAVCQMNRALGNRTDTPQQVAEELMLLLTGRQTRRFIGWPEKLFVRLNRLLPSLVSRALARQWPVIYRYAHPVQSDVADVTPCLPQEETSR
ncbi:SDR family oxidoreductase [Pseudaeromonas sharmana]|uniref:SDR family oxidoreductase n=1 Tax=Pseudaeromonas sharmana TaxID=328412 RepID=A0ABV8CQL2_9GAMM